MTYKSPCKCIESAREPLMSDLWFDSVQAWQKAHRKWDATWEGRLKRHEKVCKYKEENSDE